MTAETWPQSLAQAQGRAVQHYRERAGMKHDELAKRLRDIGQPMQRTTLINIEQGRRKTMSVPEMFALGYVLDVPPVMLMVPLGLEAKVELLEGHWVDSWQALGWISGELAFGQGTYPNSTAERTLGQEIRASYLAVQDLVENLLQSHQVLKGATELATMDEARKRIKNQSEMLGRILSYMKRDGQAFPELPSDLLAFHPELEKYTNG